LTSVRDRILDTARWASRVYSIPSSPLRPLPDFLILGAQRSGTTSLYRYLAAHPAVMPVTLGLKGAHYFDTNYMKSESWYRSHFPTAAARRARARKHQLDRVVTGEGSPYYLFHELIPERVFGLLPDARLIVLLRDPVRRAYSHHQHEVARGFEQLDFDEALRREPDRLNGEVERLREHPGYLSFNHQHFSYLARGRYLEQIRRWDSLFAKEQILILNATDFFSDPDASFRQVLRFLDLPVRSLPQYDKRNAHEYDDMSHRTRSFLVDYFKPHNEGLAQYLGRDLGWMS
jgi:hypothetical protein